MQRRVGKGQAHIASPKQLTGEHSTYDKEQSSVLNRKSFGVTNRIWALVAGFLCILAFTHFIVPTPTSHSIHRTGTFPSENLIAKNYVNASATEPNPFSFCPVYGPGDLLAEKYGSVQLSKTRLHLGSGARMQKVMNRALLGQPVTISIIGGSVSTCHGSGDDPISPECYPYRFFNWWNSIFPHPASELTNGAMRKTTSEYFGFCSAHHLPDVTDLVIIELDVDDIPSQDMTSNFELLVRSILLRPDEPAVLILGHFSPQVQESYGFAGPDHWHNVVAQFYDVPHITIKSLVYPDYMRDPNSIKSFYADPVLASPQGHELLADVLIAYFQSQTCTSWAIATGNSFESPPPLRPVKPDAKGLFGGIGKKKGLAPPDVIDQNGLDADGNRKIPAPGKADHRHNHIRVPPSRLSTKPHDARPFQEIAPFCVAANDLINPLPPSLFYGSGWTAVHPKSPSPSEGGLSPTTNYWHSTLPMSKMRIPLQLGAGDVGIYYIKEPISQVGEGSGVECWVDDNYAGAKVVENAADVGEPTPALEIIDRFVARGSHYVECQLLGEEGTKVPSFKILGVFAS